MTEAPEPVELLLKINAETSHAVLVDDEDGVVVWLPKSQIEIQDEDWEQGQSVNILISEWLAIEKGLV